MEAWRQWKRANGAAFAGRPLGAGSGSDGGAGCVLIVDDDAAVRLLCAVTLEAEGLRVLEAADGLEGVERARREGPDLVLTDVVMPGLDGFQLAETLRADRRTRWIPLIFLSGEVETANAERARKLGALAYLRKPFDPCALAQVVAHELVAARAGRFGLTALAAGSSAAQPT